MTSGAVPFSPSGWPLVIPRIVAHDAKDLVAFMRKVFNATGTYDPNRPTEMNIGGSIIMVSDAGERAPTTAFLYVYVTDTDATFRRALAAGATVMEEPAIQPYGDRRAMVRDKWGNIWQIATHLRKGSDASS
jgi:PhnB protein